MLIMKYIIGKQPAILSLLLTGIIFLSTDTLAADNLIFKGELIEPPACVINDGDDIVVPFGNVGVNKVDGINYLKDIIYRINCEEQDPSEDLSLIIEGAETLFDTAALQTNVNDLGIKFLQNGKPFALNKAIEVDPSNPPKLQAVPVKKPGSTLKEQPFEATATLRANYQ